MAAENQQHFVVVPQMAQGHINRALGLSRLFAERGALVSVITTPVNAARNKLALDRLASRGLPVRLVELRFPCAEVGLPDGCESFDLLPSPTLFGTFYEATRLLETQLESFIREEERDQRRPTCIVSDMVLPWTATIAERLRMPRLIFHGPPCFTLLSMHCILKQGLYDRAAPEDAPIRAAVPRLPLPLEIVKAQATAFTSDEFLDEALEAESTADGVVVNTFEELEGWFVDKYREETGRKVWTVGPASPTLGTEISNVGQNECTEWLDSMEPGSVMYVNFGSIVVTPPSQLVEMGLGLEASGCRFLLVIKEKEIVEEVREWLEGGFEERTKERGFILKGWAPQATILSHQAIGGFWTHCGWNSVLECIAAGLPMIAWPQFGDQHLNSRLVTDVLRIGVRPEAKGGMLKSPSLTRWTAGRYEIEKAVRRLMDRGEEGEDRRKRASEFGAKAKEAMEVGGSSFRNMTQLIEFVANHEYNN